MLEDLLFGHISAFNRTDKKLEHNTAVLEMQWSLRKNETSEILSKILLIKVAYS